MPTDETPPPENENSESRKPRRRRRRRRKAAPKEPPEPTLRRRVFDASSVSADEPKPRSSRGKRRGGGGRRHRGRPAAVAAFTTDGEETFGSTWWGKRWIEAIESVSTAYANRLPRGVNYARQGHVKGLTVTPGKVEAQVSGRRSNPYKVTVSLRTLSNAQWKKVVEQLGDRAAFTANLLAGEMPERITDVFEQCGLSLFPRRMRELKASCSCPDWANPCKHIAATHFVIGEALDNDPFLLLTLRGRTREDVLAALRAARSGEEVGEEALAGPGKERYGVSVGQLDANGFYEAEDDFSDFRFHIAEPEVDMAILRRLGEPPSWSLETPLETYFTDIYHRTAAHALQLGMSDEVAEAPALPASVLERRQKEEELLLLSQEEEEPRGPSVPPGAELVAIPNEAESDEDEDDRPSDGPTVLVRRASKASEQQRERRRKDRRRRPEPVASEEAAVEEPMPQTTAPSADGAPRLSRRVVPGTTTDSTTPTLEDRLEMIIPITESMPDGPKIARQIIWALKTHGPATARQLARRTRMKKAAVLQLLQSLLAVGLVVQEGQGERARFTAQPT